MFTTFGNLHFYLLNSKVLTLGLMIQKQTQLINNIRIDEELANKLREINKELNRIDCS
jgi:hypothetical protein